MNEILLAMLGAAEPIEPGTVVALPLSAFWIGMTSLITVAVSLITITYKISTFTTRVEIDLEGIKERLNNHSDLFDDNHKTHHDIDKRLAQLEPRRV